MFTRTALASALLSLAILAGCSNSHKELARANALQKAGKTVEAREVYESLLPRARSKSAQSQIYVQIGECEWTLERHAEALSAFLKAAELDSNNLSAQLHLAQLFLAGGVPDRALVFADIVLSHDPKNLDAMAVAAGAYAYLGNMSASIARFQEVLQRDPGREDAAVTLAQIYSSQGRTDEAANVLRTSAAKAPKSAAIQLAIARLEEEQGHPQDAEAAYRKAVSVKDDADTNLRLAQFLERSARIDEAEAVLRKVDSQRPSKPFALADFQLAAGKGTDASQHYLDMLMKQENKAGDTGAASLAARAIESKLALASQQTGSKREQTLMEARTALGTHRAVLGEAMTSVLAAEFNLVDGDPHAAESLARGALEAHSDLTSARYVLGLALSREGKDGEARAEWQSVLDDDPNFVPARLSLAEMSLAQGDATGAEQFVIPVVRQEPANLAALALFGRVLIAEKQYPAANSIALRYEAVDKASPVPHLLMGEAALAQKRLAYALLEFEQAVVLDPNSAEAMDGLVRVYRMGTITRPMLQHMEKTAMAPPSSPALMEIAGRLYAQHGWAQDAARCYQKTLQLDPRRTTAALELASIEARAGDQEAAKSSAAATSISNSELMAAIRKDDESNGPAAIRAYEEALKKGDSTGVAANNLAWIYAKNGTNLDRALELAQRAREANPMNPAVTDTLGFVLLKRRDYSMALAELKHADQLLKAQKSKDSQLADAIHAHLAEAYRNVGETHAE